MRHQVIMFVGSSLEGAALELKQYLLKYGSEATQPFQQVSHLVSGTDGLNVRVAESRLLDGNRFYADLMGEHKVEWGEVKQVGADALGGYMTSLFRTTVTINNRGDNPALLLTIVVPMWESVDVASVAKVVDAASQLQTKYEVDVVALMSDVAPVLTAHSENDPELKRIEAESLQMLLKAKETSHQTLHHLIPLCNINAEGFALGLDTKALNRILGEFSLMCVENYDNVLKTIYEPGKELTGLGLAMLQMDRYYFVQYLLSKAYLHILNREEVTQDEVDINKVAPVAQRCIKDTALQRDFTRIFSAFWEKKVVPLLDSYSNQNDVIAHLSTDLKELFDNEITDALQSYISNDALSIPERKCVLALVLAQDDELLKGHIFNDNQLSVDDIIDESLRMFVAENNRHKETLVDDEGNVTYRHLALQSPCDEHGDVYVPTEHIRQLKKRMRDNSAYIRTLNNTLSTLEGQMADVKESERRLSEDGFFFEGKTYKMLPTIKENTFEENYTGHDKLPKSVDMRNDFTAIRDQGPIGSCASFATVAVVEYMLKRGKKEENLSEAYVFHNAVMRAGGDHEQGSSIYDNIISIHDDGVPSEHLWPYTAENCVTDAPQSVHDDAMQRRVITAKNVVLRKGERKENLKNLKSAIADGFPVIISLRLSEAFHTTGGFVQTPSREEVESHNGVHSNHAMVICGYSDDQRVFIVRNSWGRSFGDNGYCYIPYSYIGDTELCQVAFIITEIVPNVEAANLKPSSKHQVNFDQTDNAINYAITRNLLGEALVDEREMEELYAYLQTHYRKLVGELRNPIVRQKISDAAQRRIDATIQSRRDSVNETQKARSAELDNHDRQMRSNFIYMCITAFVILASLVVSLLKEASFGTMSQVLVVVEALLLLIMWLVYRRGKVRRFEIMQEYEAKINSITDDLTRLGRELSVLKMKFHFAGVFVDECDDLRNELMKKYNLFNSFAGNLKLWMEEEREHISQMDPSMNVPFVSLLNNATLDAYFEQNADLITNDIHLADFFSNFSLDEQGIINFQKRLKQSVVERLSADVDNFSMVKFVLGTEHYGYVDANAVNFDNLFSEVAQSAAIFMQYKQLDVQVMPTGYLLTHTTGYDEQKVWEDHYTRHFRNRPIYVPIQSPFTLGVVNVMRLNKDEIEL